MEVNSDDEVDYFTTDEENEWEDEEEEEEIEDDEDHVLGVRVDDHRPLVPLDMEDEEEFPPLIPPLQQGEEEEAEEQEELEEEELEEEEGDEEDDLPFPEDGAHPPAVQEKEEKAEHAEGEVIALDEDEGQPFVYLDDDEENVLCCPICLEHMNEVFGFISAQDANGACTHWVCEPCAVDMQERVGQGNNFECPFCRRIVMAYSRNLIATQILQQLQRRHKEGQVLSKQMQAQRVTLERRLAEERDARDTQTQELVGQIRQLQQDSQQYIEELQQSIDAERQQKLALEAAVGGLQAEKQQATTRSNATMKKMEMQLERLRLNGQQSTRAFEQERKKLLNMEKNSQQHAKREIDAMRERVSRMKTDLDASNTVQDLLQKKCKAIVRQLHDKERDLKRVRGHLTTTHETSIGGEVGVMETVQTMISSWWWSSPSEFPVASLAEYKLLEIRGERRDGRVRKARHHHLQKLVALKAMTFDHSLIGSGNALSTTVSGLWQLALDGKAPTVDPELQETARATTFREIMLLHKLSHPHIIPVLNLVAHERGRFFMAMPYLEHDLAFLCKAKRIPERDVKSFMHQLLCAVHYLHSAGVVHRQLSSSAVIMDTIQRVYLAGFSQAISVESLTKSTCKVHRQNLCYAAPELLYLNYEQQPQENWYSIDAWALGCILAEVYLRRTLFSASKNASSALRSDILCNQLRFVECNPRDEGPITGFEMVKSALRTLKRENAKMVSLAQLLKKHSASPDAVDLISRLLTFDPQERLSVEEALEHRFFSNLPGKDTPIQCQLYAELADNQISEFVKKYCDAVL